MAGRLRRLRSLRPFVPPAALFAGLFLFGVSLLVLGTGATDEGPREMHPATLTLANGTATLAYPVPFFERYSERIEVSYAFPQAIGDAHFVGCDDLALLRQGLAPTAPMLSFTNLSEGEFVVSRQTVTDRDPFFTVERDETREPARTYRIYCSPAVAFQWSATEGDPVANRPDASVVYHPEKLHPESFAFLAILMGGSALLALLGGLGWIRANTEKPAPLPQEDSTVEALRTSLDRMGAQLERTRKTLLLAGVLGVFLWYPFLVPWAWEQAARSSDNLLIPWAVAALTLTFLIVLTVLWAREFLRLDRALTAWRSRLQELRDREEHLMDSLEQGG